MATHLTKEQCITAVKHYYQSGENGVEASRTLAKQFGIPPPQGQNITFLVKKFKEMASMANIQQSGMPSTTTTTEKENELAKAIHQSPQTSSQHLAIELEISQWSVLKLLKNLGMKPYIP